ncbi:hypothetical protein ACFOPX_06650 [Helicobacter baculiformis]|uniref:Uncharacterized protein n=1 Tax=Helicobacter baculiformis TaxID=427351 RepID=A0ABV7ZIU3_9HELI|nr:hypothetical protein [Helicobacter baculiformis]
MDTQEIFTGVLVFIFSLCLQNLHALELKEAQAVVQKWVDDRWKEYWKKMGIQLKIQIYALFLMTRNG